MTTETDDDRFVHVLLEETAGGLEAPDLRQRVLARAAAGVSRRDRGSRTGWAAAALVALGLGVVGYAAWRGGSVEPGVDSHGGAGPGPAVVGTIDGDGGQDPEVIQPDSIEAFHELLRDVQTIRVNVWTAPPHGAEVRGTEPMVFAARTEVDAVCNALRSCRAFAPGAVGWKWPHRIELILESGAVVVCAVYPYADRLGVQGIGDLEGSRTSLTPLRALVERAARAARRERGVVYAADEFGVDAADPIPRASERLELWNLADADLAGLTWFDSVRVLDLSHCKGLTDAAMAHVAQLGTLEEIRFGYSSISDVGLAALAALTRLRKLDLRYNGGRDAVDAVFSGEGFAAFDEHRSLAVLGLTYCRGLTDAGLARIAELPALEALDLSGRRTGRVTATGLGALGRCATLATLDLSDCPLDLDEAMQGWTNLAALRHLDLSDTSVSAEGLRQLVVSEALEHVEVDRCANVDGEALALVTYLPSLRVLHASRIPARGADLFHLGTATGLAELHLDQTPITAEVAEVLAKLVGLRRLALSFCAVDDACAAQLARLPALEALDLAGSRELTDDGLAKLGTLSTLRKLDLNVCHGITADGVASLRERLPECELTLPDGLRGQERTK